MTRLMQQPQEGKTQIRKTHLEIERGWYGCDGLTQRGKYGKEGKSEWFIDHGEI